MCQPTSEDTKLYITTSTSSYTHQINKAPSSESVHFQRAAKALEERTENSRKQNARLSWRHKRLREENTNVFRCPSPLWYRQIHTATPAPVARCRREGKGGGGGGGGVPNPVIKGCPLRGDLDSCCLSVTLQLCPLTTYKLAVSGKHR